MYSVTERKEKDRSKINPFKELSRMQYLCIIKLCTENNFFDLFITLALL